MAGRLLLLLNPQGSEMKYALKRLIAGLGIGRETARPCYSLALAQVSSRFRRLSAILAQRVKKSEKDTLGLSGRMTGVFRGKSGYLSLCSPIRSWSKQLEGG